MEGIGRRRFKAEAVIEAACTLVRMRDHGSHADRLCHAATAQQSVLKQRSAKAPIGVLSVDSEPCENQDRNRTLCGLALQQPHGRIIRFDLANRERVVTDDSLSIGGDEGPGRSNGLRMPRIAMQPAVQLLVTTAEPVGDVLSPQRLRLRI